MKESKSILLVTTMDTKGEEAHFLEICLQEAGVNVIIIDAGIMGSSSRPVTISREDVARAADSTISDVQALGHEGKALGMMISGAVKYAMRFYREGKIRGIIGLGGSMGTTLGSTVMRAFPIGFPKVLISTMASRNTRPFVGTSDILMLHSVCDLAGLNRITKKILRNGAMAMAGMVNNPDPKPVSDKPLILLSTLGTTEACAFQVRERLGRNGREVVTFHTVGSGGEAMERMIREEKTTAVVDLSLHEIADHSFGGDYDAGPDRGLSAIQNKVPTILVPGNIDFLVSGPFEQTRQRFPDRRLHSHNAAITVVRTEPAEIQKLAIAIAGICNQAEGPLCILIPMGGFSAFDSENGPLHDPLGPTIFNDTLKKYLKSDISVNSMPYHINNPEFAIAIVDQLERLLN